MKQSIPRIDDLESARSETPFESPRARPPIVTLLARHTSLCRHSYLVRARTSHTRGMRARVDARASTHRRRARDTASTVARRVPRLCAFVIALSTLRCVAGYRLPRYVAPPYLTSITPNLGHVVGGTEVTIRGGGFANEAGLSARFAYYDSSTMTSEIDVVKATYVDFGTIKVVTPPRGVLGSTHVTVSNNGVGWSTTPLNEAHEGTYLKFEYSNTNPTGTWVIQNATGHSRGGAVVKIRNPDGNFLPGPHLRCRFGDPVDASATTTFTIGTMTKTAKHPWFGRGSGEVGYTVKSARLNDGAVTEGPSFILKRDTTYTFTLDSSVANFPFYISTVEPSNWEKSYENKLTDPTDNGSVLFTPTSSMPDYVYYHSTTASFMGGMIVLIDASSSDFETGASKANTVKAEWVYYNEIQCVTPPWVSSQDDSNDHGGKQVTVYVSNDGVTYHGGSGGADGAPPADSGSGTTFTYFDNTTFCDVPIYYDGSANAASYKAGIALTLTSSKYSVSPIYADDGTIDSTMKTNYASAVTTHTTEAGLTIGSGNRNDLVVEGTYTGGGVAWYEVVIDDATSGSETFRWRLHSAIGSNVAWIETGRAIPVALSGSQGGLLSQGIRIRFTSSGTHHVDGDRWLIRVYGGKPNVVTATTTHEETTYAARGPFYGNTEITIHGQGFFPSDRMKCKLHDSVTGTGDMILDAQFDSVQRVRCITKAHDPRSGGEVAGTFRPCFEKTITVSVDNGETYSDDSSAKFLFCDIYVSKSGSDTYGDGTPNKPYLTLQRSFEAALGEARSYALSYELDDLKTGIRGSSEFRTMKFGSASKIPVNKGFGYYVNRDRVQISSGSYTGAGNIGLHPLGKMLEVVSKDGTVVIDCEKEATGMIVNHDRHGSEEVTNSGSVSFIGVTHVNC